MGRSLLPRVLLISGLSAATLLGVACGSSSGSGFGGPNDGDGGVTDGSSGFQLGSGDGEVLNPNNNNDAIKAATVSIAFVPASQTLTIDGVIPQSQSFDLQATLKDGSTQIVLPDSVQFDRPDLATAKITTTTVLTASGPNAGTGTLHGVFGAFGATAQLTVNVARKDLNGVSTTIAGALDAATAADGAVSALLYPYDKTVFALGLTSPKIMWNAPNDGDTYRFHLSQGNYTYDTYASVDKPGQFRFDQAIWDTVTASNKGANTPLTLTVSRYDAASQKAYVSATETFTIAPESLRGAIYYWTASEINGVRKGHISRFRPGTGAAPVALNNGKCMGCHAVNAQGTVLVADIDDINYQNNNPLTDPSLAPYGNWSKTRAWASFDVSESESDAGAPLSLETTKFGADIALNPDGKYVVFGGPTPVAAGGGATSGTPVPGSKYLSLATVADGNVLANSGLDSVTVPSGKGMMMPAFSPDGTMLAVVVSALNADNVIPQDKDTSIQFIHFNEDNAFFDAQLNMLVNGTDAAFNGTTGTGLAYPSFTPDSKAVAFHVGHTATGCSGSCDDTTIDDGNLFIQPVAQGGKTSPVAMTAASDPPNNAAEAHLSVEPTFNPQPRGGYSWVVFTSMRSWGNEPFPSGTPSGFSNGRRRLWVAAVDPTVGTVDPSHPAIYLEGQEDTPNMRGFWANAACTATAPAGSPPNACTAGYECCSGFCVNNTCVDPSSVACAGLGQTCNAVADCCNPSAVACVNNSCTAVGVVK